MYFKQRKNYAPSYNSVLPSAHRLTKEDDSKRVGMKKRTLFAFQASFVMMLTIYVCLTLFAHPYHRQTEIIHMEIKRHDKPETTSIINQNLASSKTIKNETLISITDSQHIDHHPLLPPKTKPLPLCPNLEKIKAYSNPHHPSLQKTHTFYSHRWGNVLSPYWATRAVAELGGYDYEGTPFGTSSGTWMRYLPTSVPRRNEPNPAAYERICRCREDWEFFHKCPYGWADIRETITNDTRRAISDHVKNAALDVQKLLVVNDDDWLIYERCCIFCHPLHGFTNIKAYDIIPPTGHFTVYTLSPPNVDDNEGNGLCHHLQTLRNSRITKRNPNVTVVSLDANDAFVDFARLVYAKNLLIPSCGTSWALWASLANNNGRVHMAVRRGGEEGEERVVVEYEKVFRVMERACITNKNANDFLGIEVDDVVEFVKSKAGRKVLVDWYLNSDD